MSDEMKRDRSPNYPKMPLQQAVEVIASIHRKTGRSSIRPEVLASALGYASLNGAALTTIGALNGYGLIDRSKDQGISVSQLALRLLHPVNDTQGLESRRESSLKPRVFSELYSGGFHHCSEDVLTNHLIQEGFTTDGAKKAANVFLANVEFAKLKYDVAKLDSQTGLTNTTENKETTEPPVQRQSPAPAAVPVFGNVTMPSVSTESAKVLASYSVPLGSCEVTVTFTGDKIYPDDFDALGDFVAIFKKQYERRQAKENQQKTSGPIDPTPPTISV